MKKTVALVGALAAMTLVLSACAAADDTETAATTTTEETTATETVAAAGSVLESVQEAGVVRCGTRDALPGFAVLTEAGEHEG